MTEPLVTAMGLLRLKEDRVAEGHPLDLRRRTSRQIFTGPKIVLSDGRLGPPAWVPGPDYFDRLLRVLNCSVPQSFCRHRISLRNTSLISRAWAS